MQMWFSFCLDTWRLLLFFRYNSKRFNDTNVKNLKMQLCFWIFLQLRPMHGACEERQGIRAAPGPHCSVFRHAAAGYEERDGDARGD